jgi:multidrug efflux pump subunit AcrB
VNNGTIGIIFVIIALLFFLSPRVAFVTAIGIPIAFMMTFSAMWILGMNINLISLFGLILVLGMLVDDAIVVSENVFRHIENGVPFKKAAVVGTREVWKAVTSTVLTTIAAFLPLMFMTGIMGKFVWSIPMVVILALTASLLEAFFILPSHLAEMGRIPKTNVFKILHIKRPKHWIKTLTVWYTKVLGRALGRRYLVSGGVVVLLIGSFVAAKLFLPVVLFPARGIDLFFIRAKLPVGTPLEVTEEKFKTLENLVSSIPNDELDDYVTQLGIVQNDPDDPFTERSTHVGQIAVYLTPSADRERETKDIISDLREKGKEITGFEEINYDEVIPGPPVGKPIAVRIRGDDSEKIDKLSEKVKDFLGTVSGVKDIKDDYDIGKSEWRVVVNEENATKAGLTVGDVASAVRNAFGGGIATTIKKSDEEIDVRVRFPYGVKYDETKLFDVDIKNRYGNLVPLKMVASFIEKPGVSAIKHLDRRRVVTVSANVNQDVTTSLEVSQKLAKHFKDFQNQHPGYTISFGGEYEETEKSMQSLFKAFALAVILIFLILATNFKSLVQPVIVMMAIPFGFIGVIIAFFVHGEPLSFLALLGVVGLSGVVVNSSIILMDFINKKRAEGEERRQAIIEAGALRIRPVLITAATTVVGLLPVAYGLWGSDPILIPAALALMWGIIFATGLTLIVIPCFYAIVDDINDKMSFLRFWKPNNNDYIDINQ